MVSNYRQFLGQKSDLEDGQKVEFMFISKVWKKLCVFSVLTSYNMGSIIISVDETL